MRPALVLQSLACTLAIAGCGKASKELPDGGSAPPACEATTCSAQGKDCGAIPDGCGGTLECGTCGAGQACGAGGAPNVCAAVPPACVPATCQAQGKNCGTIGDGCGGTLVCGTCGAGQVCGAAGTANVCSSVTSSCTATTCQAQGRNCGTIPDGCGGTLDCGTCSGDEACGGGGKANVCGVAPEKGGDTRWVTIVGGDGDQGVLAVAVGSNGDFVAVSQSASGAAATLSVARFDAAGKQRWSKSFGSADFVGVTARGVALSPLGNIFVAVAPGCFSSCSLDFGGGKITTPTLVKLSATGAFVWQVGISDYTVTDVAADGSGSVAVQHGYAGGVDKYGFDGRLLWSAPVSGARTPTFDPDGNLVVTFFDPSDGYRPKLAKVDPGGTLLWTQVLSGWPAALATTATGTIVVLEFDHVSAHEASDGTERFRIALPMWAQALAVVPAGRAYVAGQDSAGCNDFAVRKYDLTGKFLWSRMIAAQGSCAGAPRAASAAPAADGGVVIGGSMLAPADMGKGLVSPTSVDGFLLDLAP